MRFRRVLATSVPLAIAAMALFIGNAQTPPAPTEDRVGFPEGYQGWPLLYVLDRPDNRQIRTVYANEVASGVSDGKQGDYPYGSVVVMETWNALRSAAGDAILDANGRFQKDPAATPTIFVMRKGRGFGEAYGPNRTGEWEYVSYTPARAIATPPSGSFTCATCHLQAGPAKDFVFRASLRFKQGGDDVSTGAVPTGIIKNYAYIPGNLTVKAGAKLTFYNDDVVAHTIADDVTPGWTSQLLRAGTGTITLSFPTPGEFNYHCSVHPNMRAKITVIP